MDKDTVVSLDLQDRDRALDWLTALSPIWLMGIIYFRWWALFLPVVTAAGYLAASWLLGRLRVLEIRVPAACCTGLLIALCLPSTTPVWVGALAGMAAAGVTALPTLLRRRWADAPALLHPALVGYLMVRLIFPAETTAFTMPAMWATDAVSSATPLAALGEPLTAEGLPRLLMGVYPSAIGEGCVPVILLAALYLLLRRRLRLIAPAAMLGGVTLLSWMVWGNPLGGLLSGGVAMGALLLADRAFVPASYGPQALTGLVAAAVTVVLRAVTGTDGTAVGVLLGCALSPFYPALLRYSRRAAIWLWAQIRRYAPVVWSWLLRLFGRHIPAAARRVAAWAREIFAKTENKC